MPKFDKVSEISGIAGVDTLLRVVSSTVTDSLKYWELRRLLFNLFLAAETLAMIVYWTWAQGLANTIQPRDIPELIFFATIANILYCAVYLPDMFVQLSAYRDVWRRWRWTLFGVVLLLSGVFTYAACIYLFGPDNNW
jgi:hypothetical protein